MSNWWICKCNAINPVLNWVCHNCKKYWVVKTKPENITTICITKDDRIQELEDKLYHATREVDEVKYKLGHKIEVLVSAIKESISRSDDSGDSYNSQPIRDVLKEIEGLT
jgi:hypothetical protein